MPSKPTPCLEAALSYIARGWSAIPLCPWDHDGIPGGHQKECKSPGKAPLWPWKTYQERTPKEAEVKLWWNRVPFANVGIALGPVTGLLGLDIDGDQGEALLQEWSHGEPINTLEFQTPGGGRRLLFKYPFLDDIHIKSHKQGAKEAIRVLVRGSQTVAPPSRHACGDFYAWTAGHGPDDIQAAECPQWLLDQLAKQDDQKGVEPQTVVPAFLPPPASPDLFTRAKAYLAQCEPAIAGQGGHNQTFKVACKLVKGFGLDAETAYTLMLTDYNPRCTPPWSEKELRHKTQSAIASEGEIGFLLKTPQFTANAPPTNGVPKHPEPAKAEAHTRKFKSIETKAIEWLWQRWVPLGKLTILDGDPGLGKSTMLLDLAARVSTSGTMPDQSIGTLGNVIIMSAEDAPEDTIRPRLEAAAANLDRVIDLSHVVVGGQERPPEIPSDLPLIEAKIRDHQARLLIIDPLMAFLYGADANKDQEIRRVLYKLSKIAEKHRCSIICMRHLNKSSNGKAIYRGNSSIGVIGHARAGLLVAQDPDNEDKRVLAVSKSNLAAKPKSLTFVLDPVGDVCRVGWCGTSHYIADQLVAPPPTKEEQEAKDDKHTKMQQAKTIIEWLIGEDGKVEVQTAKKECFAAGLSLSTIERAVKDLALTVSYTFDPETHKRIYYWTVSATPSGDEGLT